MDKKNTIVVKAIRAALSGDAKEIIIREGKAPEIHVPSPVKLGGRIEAPADFWDKRKDQFNAKNCNVVVNEKKMTISLVCDEQEKASFEVTGALEFSDELKAFNIVKDTSEVPRPVDQKSLARLIRFNKRFFSEAKQCNEVLESLVKMSVKAVQDIQEHDTNRGTKGSNFQVKVTTDVPTSFVLLIPILKGQPAKKFKVDICLDVRDREVEFWLESPELCAIIEEDVKTVIKTQVDRLSEIVIIKQ